MPIYEYQCQKCNHLQDIIAGINDKIENTIQCDKCGFWAKRIISKNTFILSDKGKVGWSKEGYVNK